MPVHFYRRFISPLVGPRCRYHPTCSTYAVEAIRTYGVIRGSVLAVWRLLRCNPFSDGGVDHVRDQRLFGARSRHEHSSDCAHKHEHEVVAMPTGAAERDGTDSGIAA